MLVAYKHKHTTLSDIVQNFRPQNSCNIIDDGIVVRNDSIAKRWRRQQQQQYRAAKSDVCKPTTDLCTYIYEAPHSRTHTQAATQYKQHRAYQLLMNEISEPFANEWVSEWAMLLPRLLQGCCHCNTCDCENGTQCRQSFTQSHTPSVHSKCYSLRPDSGYYWEMHTWLATTTVRTKEE